MNCDNFRKELAAGSLTPEALAHLRSCTTCLDAAVAVDPDDLFRSLGGEMVPPGGTDLFVEDVIRQVHLREAEGTLGRRVRFAQPYRWAVAAALAIAILGITLTNRDRDTAMVAGKSVPRTAPASTATFTTVAAVESYEEGTATIVELPATETDDVKIVMIFDETLPVDL